MRRDQSGAEPSGPALMPVDRGGRGGNGGGALVRSMKTSERVAMDVVRDIVEQRLQPGDRLAGEAAMLDRYGPSRASVREALRLLEVQGLISLKPGPRG